MDSTVAQFVRILNTVAPLRLAESWDPVGLQIGSPGWPVKKIWTALDPLVDVVEQACQQNVDLLVTHHPLFFKPIQNINADSPTGKIIQMAMTHHLAIYSAHTNLDSVSGGVNDVLADRIGLKDRTVLVRRSGEMGKLVVFVPFSHVKIVLDALSDLGAGRIGNYAGCSFRCEGHGTFLPEPGAAPTVGDVGSRSTVQESRIEVLIPLSDARRILAGLKAVHPYETMACDIYPLSGDDPENGLGRVGSLPGPVLLGDLALRLKTELGLSTVKIVGPADKPVQRVAVCSGSGGSLLNAAISSGADVYISGDLGYHTAQDAQQAGMALIDAGHFSSERLIVDVLATVLQTAAAKEGLEVTVTPAKMEADPFHYL